MFSESIELYDLLYGAFKDYAGEAEAVAALLRARAPDATRLLDVGCGTGAHALHLVRDHGYAVHGLDVEEAFVETARAKVPEAVFHPGDMADFDLGLRFDAVLCLFSSIGYVGTVERLRATLARFRDHLEPGGVAVVEPWFTPEAWHPGRVYLHTGEADGRQVVRMSHSTVEGRTSRLRFHYLVGGPEGIEHRVEDHALALFTREETADAFEAAGFVDVAWDADGLTDRGLWVARRSG